MYTKRAWYKPCSKKKWLLVAQLARTSSTKRSSIIVSQQKEKRDGLYAPDTPRPLHLPPRLRCMVAGAALADLRAINAQKGGGGGGGGGRAPTALVIGLGGGALPMALRRMYPGVKVVAVELDPEIAGVAKKHFGLRESDGLKVRRWA